MNVISKLKMPKYAQQISEGNLFFFDNGEETMGLQGV